MTREILGYRRCPRYRKRKKHSAQWEVAVERPVYDLTIFKLHCGKLTLKIYTKGERVLRWRAAASGAKRARINHCELSGSCRMTIVLLSTFSLSELEQRA